MYKIEDNYKFSNAFGGIDSQLSTIEEVLTDFLTDGVKLVEEKQRKMDELFDKIEKIDSEQAAIFDQHEYEPARLKNIDLKNTFLTSGLGYLYSQFEFLLSEISIRSDELFGPDSAKTIKRNKARVYHNKIWTLKAHLIDTYKINLADKERDWMRIDNFRKIRNFFIHSNGNILKNDAIQQYIDNEPNISLFSEEIILTKEYILDHSKILINYLRTIMDKLYEKRKELQRKESKLK